MSCHEIRPARALPLYIFTLFFLLFSTLAFAQNTSAKNFVNANILTGGPTGTYIQIGRDIAAVAKQNGLDLTVHESAGSLENIYGVYKRPQTQFGIVQSDVLDFIRNLRKNDLELQKISEKTRIVFPLYNEEIHIIVKPSINTVDDLKNARVSIGQDNSGTQLTATFILDALGMTPKETISQSPRDSIDLFLNDQIDAFFYVGGAPLKLLTDERLTSENAKILPIENEILSGYYVQTTIPANTYRFQTEEVKGIAVKAVLMTYEFGTGRTAYARASCDIVSRVTAAVLANMEQLKDGGHPKWKTVDLNDIPPNWEKGICALKGETLANKESKPVFTKPEDCNQITNPVTKNLCLLRTQN